MACGKLMLPFAFVDRNSRTSSSEGFFTVQYHAYASREYLERFGEPETIADLDRHRIVSLGGRYPALFLRCTVWRGLVESDMTRVQMFLS